MFHFQVFVHRRFGEEYPESDGYKQCESGEDVPCFFPSIPDSHRTLAGHALSVHQTVDNRLGGERTDSSTEAVGHHHKQTLCRRALRRLGLLIHVQRAGDIEEIERKTIDDAAEDVEDCSTIALISCYCSRN